MLPTSVVAELRQIARDILKRQFPLGRRANVSAAARKATLELSRRVSRHGSALAARDAFDQRPARTRAVRHERGAEVAHAREKVRRSAAGEMELDSRSAKRVAANRKLLSRVAYEDAPRLDREGYIRLRNLLECIEPGAARRCDDSALDSEKRDGLRRSTRSSEWLGPAKPLEYAALLPGGDHVLGTSDAATAKYITDVTGLKKFPARIVDQIDLFRRSAIADGHDRRRVDMAVIRFLAPFCAFARTSGVERGWHELGDTELQRVVRYGLEIERIWLGAIPATERTIIADDEGDSIPLLGDGVTESIDNIDWNAELDTVDTLLTESSEEIGDAGECVQRL